MLQYLLQIFFFQLLFLLLFELFLRKETFFTYNRWYLLITPLVSVILPLLNFEGFQNVLPVQTQVLLPEIVLGASPEGISEIASIKESSEITFIGVLPWIYGFGVVVSLYLFFRKFQSIKQLLRHEVVRRESDFKVIVVPSSNLACTFFNTIFLGEKLSEKEREHILSHELVHVNQKHSYDLLYFELFRIVFWFNPLIYVYQEKISALHEFIADEKVVASVEKSAYYQQLLNTVFNTEDISFINQFFNQSLIKKRIVMLQKSRSTSVAKLKFLLLFPVIFLMVSIVSFAQEGKQTHQEVEKQEVKDTRLVIEVGQVENQTNEEQTKVAEALAALEKGAIYTEVVVTDGSGKIHYTLNPQTGALIKSTVTRSTKTSGKTLGDVPFALVDATPVFPGCEEQTNDVYRKECTREKITNHVNTHFNTNIGKGLGLTGNQKIYVQFKIDQEGKVEVMGVRGPRPELEKEAERVVNTLPKMQPGKQRGEAVSVLYSLPIQYRIAETKE